MKVIATILADLETTPLGTASRLDVPIDGIPILTRTVQRVRACQRIGSILVLVPSTQADRAAPLLEGTGAVLRRFDGGPPPWAALVRAARKWSLDGWRGGIGGTTCFDEYTHVPLVSEALKGTDFDAVLSVPPAAPAFHPGLADRMIEMRAAAGGDVRMVFSQAPPGVGGILMDVPLVHELCERQTPIGWVFAYKPDAPRKDLIFEPCCCDIPVSLRYARGRLIADTQRSMARVSALLTENLEPDLTQIGDWLRRREADFSEPLPQEVEIELTTEDPYPDAVLRPRGQRLGRKGQMDPALAIRVAREAAELDDTLVVLGGFGDPLRHPAWRDILVALNGLSSEGRRPYGLAVRTTGVDLDDDTLSALIDAPVDVLNVVVDAWSAPLYAQLQAPGGTPVANLDAITASLTRLTELRRQQRTVTPILVPELTKARQNVHELDDFFDGWIRRCGAASVSGASHLAQQFPDHRVINMAPTAREACRRIRSRCLVLADGRVTACDQDFRGVMTLGSVADRPLREVWTGEAFESLRGNHRNGRYDANPLCAACEDWQRP